MRLRLMALGLVLTAGLAARGEVHLMVKPVKESDHDGGRRLEQAVSFANDLAGYTLNYDIIRDQPEDERIRSHWWAWTTGLISLGMTAPSQANWYFQAFLDWDFDDIGLHEWPATLRVIRPGGPDAMVEYTWDTPKVTARLRFAMVDGSDKLLLFAAWEPKTTIASQTLRLSCYPTGFAQPRQRAVTTATGTVPAGSRIDLDLAAQRWLLYEDLTPDRPGDGPAGLLVGTPAAFDQVEVAVGEYEIRTLLRPKPTVQSFALALYDYPALPELATNRAYFQAAGDAEATWLEQAAAGDLDQPLPAFDTPAFRRDQIATQGRRLMQRAQERWRPDPAPLDWPWAERLSDGPVRTVLFCPRWAAWETMELARRLPLQVDHLYFDRSTGLADSSSWPYATATGDGSLGTGPAMRIGVGLLEQPETEVYLVTNLAGEAIPPMLAARLARQVAAGRGLLLVGADPTKGWPAELLATPDQPLAEAITAALPGLPQVPGFEPEGRGRGPGPLVSAWRHGQGRVVALSLALNAYSAVVPRNTATEGLDGATDRAYLLAARALLAAAGRPPGHRLQLSLAGEPAALEYRCEPAPPAGARLQLRFQNDLDQVAGYLTIDGLAASGAQRLPALAVNRTWFVDAKLVDAAGAMLDAGTIALPPSGVDPIAKVELEPAEVWYEHAAPVVQLAEAGDLRAVVTLAGDPGTLPEPRLQARVSDSLGRILAEEVSPVEGTVVRVDLAVGRPVTVNHQLDLELVIAGRQRPLAVCRLHFTRPMAWPHDDFTTLVWTYAGYPPVLRETNRLCYEQGAGMQDLCHVGGYSGAAAAREYQLASRSGLRLVPYVTRLAFDTGPDNTLRPSLHDTARNAARERSVVASSQQALPYFPVAFTLGDENYLARGAGEIGWEPDNLASFRTWLATKYGTVARLNEAWGTALPSFEAVVQPMTAKEVAERPEGFAPWLDHMAHLDWSFAELHRSLAGAIRAESPGMKVGWDGLLSYTWNAGYNFDELCDGLELNQTYTVSWLQGELVRSLARPGAMRGKWGNLAADGDAGFAGHPWDGLFSGDNSVWWWTSWGVDYIPFNPDLSPSRFAEPFFREARAVAAGPGRLLLGAERIDSPIAVLYAHRDVLASHVLGQVSSNQPFDAPSRHHAEHEAMLRAIRDLGYQYRHIVPRDLLEAATLDQFKYLFLPTATCLSEAEAAGIAGFVDRGGVLVANGRAGLLTGDGAMATRRPLDALCGVAGATGLAACTAPTAEGEVTPGPGLDLAVGRVRVLEPGLRLTTGRANGMVGETPVLVVNDHGEGGTVYLNLSLTEINSQRRDDGPAPLLDLIDQILDLPTPAAVTLVDGGRPRCLQQVLWRDGDRAYLGLSQDLLLPGRPPQTLTITLPEPRWVRDVRTGQPVGDGAISSWQATVGRGDPLLYALLPEPGSGLDLTAPAVARAGEQVAVTVAARPAGPRTVVRLEVFAPGSPTAHREYSQTIDCPAGTGAVTVPFALNDTAGDWRLVARDVATGQVTQTTLALSAAAQGQ